MTSSEPARARARRAPWRAVGSGYAFVAGYVILLAAFGVVPVVYAVYFAFTNADNYFAGLSNFVQSAQDFRYLPALEHIGVYLVIWLVALVVLVTGLALVLHQLSARRLGALVRFLYYIPGALAGAASVLVWLFMLDPTVSPASSSCCTCSATARSGMSSRRATCRSCSRSSRSGPVRAAGSW